MQTAAVSCLRVSRAGDGTAWRQDCCPAAILGNTQRLLRTAPLCPDSRTRPAQEMAPLGAEAAAQQPSWRDVEAGADCVIVS